MVALSWMWVFTSAWAEDPGVLLAPNPADLAAAEQELRERVIRAEAIGRAASRLQNSLFRASDPCEDTLAIRTAAFGLAWRDAAQRARVQADRTQRMAQAPTLTPIVDDPRRRDIDALARRAEHQGRSWLEFDRIEAGSRVTCEGSLQPAVGLDHPTPRAITEIDQPVAIWVLSGTLCPGPRSQHGVAVVDGPICVDLDPACSCTPAPVLPGAVLTP